MRRNAALADRVVTFKSPLAQQLSAVDFLSSSSDDADISSVDDDDDSGDYYSSTHHRRRPRLPLELDYDYETWDSFRSSLSPPPPYTTNINNNNNNANRSSSKQQRQKMVKNLGPPVPAASSKPVTFKTNVLYEDQAGVMWSPFDEMFSPIAPPDYNNNKQPDTGRKTNNDLMDNNKGNKKPKAPTESTPRKSGAETYRVANNNQPPPLSHRSSYNEAGEDYERPHQPVIITNKPPLSPRRQRTGKNSDAESSEQANKNDTQPKMLPPRPEHVPQFQPNHQQPNLKARPHSDDTNRQFPTNQFNNNQSTPSYKPPSSAPDEIGSQALYSYLLTEDRKKMVGPFRVHLEQEEIYQVKNPKPDPPPPPPPQSERSHAIFSIGIENRQHDAPLGAVDAIDNNDPTATATDGANNSDLNNSVVIVRRGKLTFVDLAGSEKNSEIEDQQREANNINKGLLVLGKCIQALSRDDAGHVPYRDSKLTKVLADSLGGQSFTVMIACISPSKANIAETLTTLRYAGRAKMIRTDPALRMNPLEQMMSGLHHELKLLRAENEQLRQKLTSVKSIPKKDLIEPASSQLNYMNGGQASDGGGGPGFPNNNNNNDNNGIANGTSNKKQDNDFYDMLQEFMVENENLRQENSELQRNRERVIEDCDRIGRENENLKKQIDEITKMLRNDILPGAGKKKNNQPGHATNGNPVEPPNGNATTNNNNSRIPAPPIGQAVLPGIAPSKNRNTNHNHNTPPAVGSDNLQQQLPSRRRNTLPHQNNNGVAGAGLPPPPVPPSMMADNNSSNGDSVGPLIPPQSKVSNYPYSVPSSGLPYNNGYHHKQVRVPPPIDDNFNNNYANGYSQSHAIARQQSQPAPLPPPQQPPQPPQQPPQPPQQLFRHQQPPPPQMMMQQQQQQHPTRYIDPHVEPTQYTSRETNRKINMRHSPIVKVALPAVLRPPALFQSREPPPPTQAEIAIRENERLSQELKDLDRLIRHHYH